MSLIEIVCQAFTDEAAIFPMVHTNEKHSSSSGKSYSFSAKYFCFNFVISTDVFWKRKKSLLITFKSFLFIAEIIPPSCRKYVKLLFKKNTRKQSYLSSSSGALRLLVEEQC